MTTTHEVGNEAEQFAYNYLSTQGLQCITRNFSCRVGEIDLIMQDQSELVFVEVRFRRNTLFGGPLASVNRRKQHKIIRCAHYFLQTHYPCNEPNCRFDVVGITPTEPTTIEWIKNAFQLFA